jgi:hypothetical protein
MFCIVVKYCASRTFATSRYCNRLYRTVLYCNQRHAVAYHQGLALPLAPIIHLRLSSLCSMVCMHRKIHPVYSTSSACHKLHRPSAVVLVDMSMHSNVALSIAPKPPRHTPSPSLSRGLLCSTLHCTARQRWMVQSAFCLCNYCTVLYCIVQVLYAPMSTINFQFLRITTLTYYSSNLRSLCGE